jgi:hypothetical protein
MTKEDQRIFIRLHTEYIRRRLQEQIDDGKVPADWNGLELRWLIHDNFCPPQTNLSESEAARRNKYDAYRLTH